MCVPSFYCNKLFAWNYSNRITIRYALQFLKKKWCQQWFGTISPQNCWGYTVTPYYTHVSLRPTQYLAGTMTGEFAIVDVTSTCNGGANASIEFGSNQQKNCILSHIADEQQELLICFKLQCSHLRLFKM